MLELISGSIINQIPAINSFVIGALCSIALGFLVALIYMFKNKYSRNMAITLVLLPVTVQSIITVVSGNIGAGIAVAGAFSLVRFRSVQGNARDIGSLFFAMALGLIIGMGYILYAFIFSLLFGITSLFIIYLNFGRTNENNRIIRIMIPEDMDYESVLEDVFIKYAKTHELIQVRSTSMSSLYELRYFVNIKDTSLSKNFIDEIRSRNGNHNVQISREQYDRKEL
ncbi:MAG: DUF4956 domain-containing protein [Treponema sp.]|nr:DUF4956 domain-containing protein [Treponema sp.]